MQRHFCVFTLKLPDICCPTQYREKNYNYKHNSQEITAPDLHSLVPQLVKGGETIAAKVEKNNLYLF